MVASQTHLLSNLNQKCDRVHPWTHLTAVFDITVAPDGNSKVFFHLRSSLNTHQNLMMLACSGGWGFAMKQEAVWGVWEAGKVMKFGRNVQRVKGSQVVWLWSLNITKWLYVSTVKSCSLCDVSRCTKHLLELNAKPRRKAAILNLKYNFDRLPGTSSDQHDLWWVQSKDLGDVKLWSFWIFVK